MTTAMGDRHTLAGAYALDALDDIERREFELHLQTYADGRAEVAEFTATAAHLGAAAAVPAPPRLRQQVLDQIGRTAQLPPKPCNVRPLRGVSRRAVNLLSAAAVPAPRLREQVLDQIGRTPQLPPKRSNVRPLRGVSRRRATLLSVAAARLAAPDAVTAAAAVEGGGRASVVASEQLGEVVFLAENLPQLAEDRTYQLWLIGDEIVSGGVVDVAASGDVNHLTAGELSGVTTIALSVEPQGGSEQPTTTPIFAGDLG